MEGAISDSAARRALGFSPCVLRNRDPIARWGIKGNAAEWHCRMVDQDLRQPAFPRLERTHQFSA